MNGMNDENRTNDAQQANDENRTWEQVSANQAGTAERAGDARPVAFCQNCGKGLSVETRRVVGPAVYCEPCLAARLGGTAAGAGYAAPGYAAAGWGSVAGAAGDPAAPVGGAAGFQPRAIPNPGLAALLGLIPGVGAMYNEQYPKGIAHLVIFAGLVLFAHVSDVFILFIFGWIAYMAIEAHHTARARLDGTPLPNPFGLNDIGERLGFGKAWPAGPSVASVARDAADAADAAATEYRTMSGGFGAGPRPGPDAGAGSGHATASVPPAAATAPGAGWGAPVDQPRASYGTGYGYGQVPYTQGGYVPPPQASYGAQQAGYGVPYGMPVQAMPPVPPAGLMASRFPAGAIWLIGLGTIFLLGTTGIFRGFSGPVLLAFVLIGSGVWTFTRRMMDTGQSLGDDGTPMYRLRLLRAVRGASWLVLLGVLLLLHGLGWVRWENSWPWLVIAAGVMMLLNRALSLSAANVAYYAPVPVPPVAAAPVGGAIVPAATNEDVERNAADFRQEGN